MSTELEPLLTELEAVTAQIAATTCWEQSGEFRELLTSRCALATRLMDRQDLDASAVERIRAVIEAGSGVVVQVMAMRSAVVAAIAQAETQRRFTCELGRTVSGHAPAHNVDMKA